MNEHLRTSPVVHYSRIVQSNSAQSALGHPDDVLNDPEMSKAEKRAILAFWASDANAMEDHPALRKLNNGAIIRVDDILRAMCSLDDDDDDPPPSPAAAAIPVRQPQFALNAA